MGIMVFHGRPILLDKIFLTKKAFVRTRRLNDSTYMGIGMCAYEWSNDDVNLILEAFQKVWNNLEELKIFNLMNIGVSCNDAGAANLIAWYIKNNYVSLENLYFNL